jgi:hypothetical protein
MQGSFSGPPSAFGIVSPQVPGWSISATATPAAVTQHLAEAAAPGSTAPGARGMRAGARMASAVLEADAAAAAGGHDGGGGGRRSRRRRTTTNAFIGEDRDPDDGSSVGSVVNDNPVPRSTREAMRLDREYAGMVAGAMHTRALSAVWGPRDGTGISIIDTQRMQEHVYTYIINRINARLLQLGVPNIPEEDGPPPAPAEGALEVEFRDIDHSGVASIANGDEALMYQLGAIARKAREQFNEGWNDMLDVGIMHETVNAEIQVVTTLKRTEAIQAWDSLFPDSAPLSRIRILRRHPSTSALFAAAVGSILAGNLQTRPSSRPTAGMMQKSAVETALHFQNLTQALYHLSMDLTKIVATHQRSKHPEATDEQKSAARPFQVYFADYNRRV